MIDPMDWVRLVWKVALGFKGRGLDEEDLVGEGMIGLLAAVRTWRVELCPKFQTYAATCIRNQLLNATQITHQWANSPQIDERLIVAGHVNHARDLKAKVDRILAQLTPAQSQVIRLRYGLDQEPLTYQNIAKVIGRDPKRVIQIEQSAIHRIRTLYGMERRSA